MIDPPFKPPRIEEFMDMPWPFAEIRHPRFRYLYVGKGSYSVNGKKIDNSIQIISVEAKRKGAGAWTEFLRDLSRGYPEHTIIVECVRNPRFIRKLKSQGFKFNKRETTCYL